MKHTLRRTAYGLLLALGMMPGGTVTAQAQGSFPFQNPDLPTAQRVDDIVSRMTLPEKVSQMENSAAAIPRLGIPAYHWWNEGLHGVARAGIATVFPQAIGLAAAWDTPQQFAVASVIAEEARGKYNDAIAQGRYGYGLTFWSPNINIFRDPRWGRGQETYGEDPFLTATLGVAFVTGLQGNDPRYLELVATPKHFAVHSGPEPTRHQFDVEVSPYDLYDTYLPAFEACIRQGHAQSVMGAYNSIDGVPANASTMLLKDILRGKWGFDGYVVSDCGAITDIYQGHHYVKTAEEAAALAVKAGCDLECGGTYGALVNAVQQGLITEAEIDTSVKRLYAARFHLGMFDPVARVPYAQIPLSVVDSPAHRRLALQAARESIVLLKNAGNVLPFSKNIKSLAVIGPNANSVLLGNYSGTPSHGVTALEGIQKRAAAQGIAVTYVRGSELTEMSGMTPVPATALRSAGLPGLRGEYYSNQNLQGAAAVTRQDAQVSFVWKTEAPAAGVPHDHFSARWTGELVAPVTGIYTLAVRGDDGFRLFVNNQKVIDNWSEHGPLTQSCTVALKAGQAAAIRLEYFQAALGAEIALLWQPPGSQPYQEAVTAATQADAVVFVGGISPSLEGEEMHVSAPGFKGGDRTSLDLPAAQEGLLEAVAQAGKPVVVVLMNGSALSVNWAKAHVSAIVEAWYPGEEGGTALADVLFGDYNPAGRLPVTFYQSAEQLSAFTDYTMQGRTYRYFAGQPLYPFGYGLSYTRFAYSDLHAPRRVTANAPVTVTAQVANTGARAGDEVVELYLRPIAGSRKHLTGQSMPRLKLAGFQRIFLKAQQKIQVTFTITPSQLLLVSPQGVRDVQPGTWQVFVGGQQPRLTGVQPENVASGQVDVAG